ncbi:MAG: lycopene cyclase family protein [Actinomycetota bacterium]
MFDVFIIGAGLAGLNVARLIANQTKLSVGIMNKGAYNTNNPLRITFMDVLKEYGLDDCIVAKYNSFCVFSYHQAKSKHYFKDNIFAALDYNKAKSKLLNLLQSNNNLIFFEDQASSIRKCSDWIEIKSEKNNLIKTRVLIDASGISHFVANNYGLEKPHLYSHSYGNFFTNCLNNNDNTPCFVASSLDYGSGGGWFYPIGQDKASVGFAIITDSVIFPEQLVKHNFERAIQEVKPINTYLKQAVPSNDEYGTIPIQIIGKLTLDRILIVGDAAGQATPWNCMGIEPILRASDIVASVLKEAFKANDFSNSFLRSYQQKWEIINKKTYDNVNTKKVKIWFFPEDVWDFIIECDLNSLTPDQFINRTRYNSVLMPKVISWIKWVLFKIKIFHKRKKYKKHIVTEKQLLI